MKFTSTSLLALSLMAPNLSRACPMYDMDSQPQKLSRSILHSLARRASPSHPAVFPKQAQLLHGRHLQEEEEDHALPELIPNTGPDNGGQGYKPLTRNAFVNPAGVSRVAYTEPGTGTTYTMPDIIAAYAAGLLPDLEQGPGVGQELCYFSMQSLPPPPFIEDFNQTVPREVNGTEQYVYRYPIADMERVMELCELAGARMQQHIADGENDIVQFGGCSFGSEASKALCELDIQASNTESNTCDEALVDNAVAWPQAMAIFKITPETLEQFAPFINNWRDSPDQHRPNIVWAFAPNDYTEPGNEDHGGIHGSVFPGWGAQGGLRAKVVQCDKIDPMFIKPLGPNGDYFFGPDEYPDTNATRTLQELAFLEWDRLCGIPIGGQNDDCQVDADVPTTSTDDSETMDAPPYGLLALDEKCSYGADYIAASTTCGGDLNYAFGDDSSAREFERMTNQGIEACGQTFCQSLTFADNQGNVGVDENGFLFCWLGEALAPGYRGPVNCEEGAIYMEAMRDFTQCTSNVTSYVSEQRRLASIEAQTVAAEASLGACETVLKCDALTAASITPEWGTRFCVNFFQALRHPTNDPEGEYTWVEECGYSGDGQEGSPLYDNCAALGFGQAAPASDTETAEEETTAEEGATTEEGEPTVEEDGEESPADEAPSIDEDNDEDSTTTSAATAVPLWKNAFCLAVIGSLFFV